MLACSHWYLSPAQLKCFVWCSPFRICRPLCDHNILVVFFLSGDVNRVTDAKIAVYSCPFDAMATETKGTVLLKTASELMDFSKGEENLIEAQVKAIAEAGFNVVVSGGKVGDMARHFLNKYKIMVVR